MTNAFTYWCLFVVVVFVLFVGSHFPSFSQSAILARPVTIAFPESFYSFDTLTATSWDPPRERLRELVFNSLVKKGSNLDYVGDLAKDITTSADGKTLTFVLRDHVKFHNGQDFTSEDVKYTFDELLKSDSYKAYGFYEWNGGKKINQILLVEAPDAKTIIVRLARREQRYIFLSSVTAIPIIPRGTVDTQKDHPIGSGPFEFVDFDRPSNIVHLRTNGGYWEGSPRVQNIRLKSVPSSELLLADLQNGEVDLASFPPYLLPDDLASWAKHPNLKIERFDGANIQYLGFNTQSAVLRQLKIRQAIAYSIDRQQMIKELMFGQARIANSILPPESWAYSSGNTYSFNPEKARQLLRQAGYKKELVTLKLSAGNGMASQFSHEIKRYLKNVGLNVRVEPVEANELRLQLFTGKFQMNLGTWIGGNQDPLFLKDSFDTSKIPSETVTCCNRSRYSNAEVDRILALAINSTDRSKEQELYARAWMIVSNDLPILPLWHPANVVVASKRIGNIRVNTAGDWRFVKDISVDH